MSDEYQIPREDSEATSIVINGTRTKFKLYRAPFMVLGIIAFGAIGALTLKISSAATTSISETFATSAANFTTVKGGTWAVSGGTYKLTNPANPAAASFGNANYSIHKSVLTGDFTEKVDFTVTKTSSAYNDASVIFDWIDANNYYYASFNASTDPNTNGIFKIAGGVQTRLTAFVDTFAPATLRHATITRGGNVITVSVGSSVVGTTNSTSQPASGRLGFGSRNDTVSFDNFVVTVPGDTTAPSTPTGLKTTTVTNTSASLAWNASTDNTGVTGYQVFKNNVQVATVTGTSYNATGLTAGTSYTFAVAAIDAAANVSAKANLTVKTTNVITKPTAATTGVPSGTKLTTYTGPSTITVDGTVIDSKAVYVDLHIAAKNVIIRNSYLHCGTGNPSGNSGCVDANNIKNVNLLVENNTIIPDHPSYYRDGIVGHDYTARGNHVSHSNDGLGVFNQASFSKNTNVTAYGNYIHDLTRWNHDPAHTDGTHNDGIQIQGGANIHIYNNNVIGSVVAGDGLGTYGLHGGSALIAQQNTVDSPLVNVVIENNWFDDAQNSVSIHYLKLTSVTLTFRNNRFGTNQYDWTNNGNKIAIRVISKSKSNITGLFTNVYDATGVALTDTGSHSPIRYDEQ